jgi:hypothetical protein
MGRKCNSQKELSNAKVVDRDTQNGKPRISDKT